MYPLTAGESPLWKGYLIAVHHLWLFITCLPLATDENGIFFSRELTPKPYLGQYQAHLLSTYGLMPTYLKSETQNPGCFPHDMLFPTTFRHAEITVGFSEVRSLIRAFKIARFFFFSYSFSELDNLSACPRAAKYIKNDLLKFLPKGAIRNKEKMEELESQPVFCCGFQTSSSFSSEQRSERGDTTLHSEQEQLSDSDVQHKCGESSDMSS